MALTALGCGDVLGRCHFRALKTQGQSGEHGATIRQVEAYLRIAATAKGRRPQGAR